MATDVRFARRPMRGAATLLPVSCSPPIAVTPGCRGGSDGPDDAAVYGIAPADAGPDAQPVDAMPNQPDAGDDPPIYGVAPGTI